MQCIQLNIEQQGSHQVNVASFMQKQDSLQQQVRELEFQLKEESSQRDHLENEVEKVYSQIEDEIQ